MEDMFIDPKTKRRFFYQPLAGSVHFQDRPSSASHHQMDDCEVWRCGFYILQTVWLRCASVACARQVPSYEGKLQSQYLPDPSWVPGKTNTILSSAAFAHKHTRLYLTEFGLTGVDATTHRVVDVRELV